MILKHLGYPQLSYFISLVILINVPGTRAAYVRDLNYCSTDARGARWRLVHSYEFMNNTEMHQEWQIMHEVGECKGNGIKQISCNSFDNVQTDSGYMVLSVKREPLNNFNFSGTTLTSKENFTTGRWEMRIRFSMDDYLRMAIFTKHPLATYWHEKGEIDLAIFSLKHSINRGVNFANSRTDSESANLEPFVNQTDFHLMGIEWTIEYLQFFMDNQYSSPIAFDKSKNRTMEFSYYLRMQLGVGGIPIELPENSVLLNDLEWPCPAVIIDYIRIYEPDSSDNYFCNHLPIAEKIDAKEEQKIVDRICAQYAVHRETLLDVAASNKPITLILAISILVVLCLIAYFVNKIRTLKNSLVQEANKNNDIDDKLDFGNHYLNHDHLHEYVDFKDDNNYYEVFYEEADNKPAEYLDVQNAENDNEYLKLVDPSAESTCLKETEV